MPNPYYEIFRTYPRRLFGSWIGWISTIILSFQFFVMWLVLPMNPAERMLMLLFETLFFGGMIWFHFREQVVSQRRILTPGFATPQVIVFAGWMLLLVVGWPAIFSLSTYTIAQLSCLAVGLALLGWWILTMSAGLFIIAFGLWIWLISGYAETPLIAFLSGRHEAIGMMIFTAALAVIALTVFRMVRLTEEHPLYHRQPNFGAASLRPRMTGETNQGWSQMTAMGWSTSASRVYLPTRDSLWSRARRWASLMRGNIWMMLLQAVICDVILRLTPEPKITGVVLLCLSLFLPAVYASEMWLKQWRYLEIEFLRPNDRASFLKELGLAMWINYMEMWLAFAVVIVADALIFGSPVGPSWLEMALGGSLAMQIVLFGINVWMMRYRSPAAAFAGLMIVGIPAFIIPVLVERDFLRHQMLWAMVAGAMALLGLFLTLDGYRRWLVTELG